MNQSADECSDGYGEENHGGDGDDLAAAIPDPLVVFLGRIWVFFRWDYFAVAFDEIDGFHWMLGFECSVLKWRWRTLSKQGGS